VTGVREISLSKSFGRRIINNAYSFDMIDYVRKDIDD
jgi:hypothetical protein